MIIIVIGSAALGGHWLPLEASQQDFFYGVRLLALRPTPNLEGQDIPFCLGHHPSPVWHGRPYQ
jgi:hypothetical protein